MFVATIYLNDRHTCASEADCMLVKIIKIYQKIVHHLLYIADFAQKVTVIPSIRYS